ncbi:MAG: hypothetical protein WKG07_00060 [Hymenobacter sp.]
MQTVVEIFEVEAAAVLVFAVAAFVVVFNLGVAAETVAGKAARPKPETVVVAFPVFGVEQQHERQIDGGGRELAFL